MSDLLTLFPMPESSKAKHRLKGMIASRNNDVENDFYPTPEIATMLFLEREKFEGQIWECACGDGAMSKVLEKFGYEVESTDLVYRGYGSGGVDFLRTTRRAENIVTNPPYELVNEFIAQALEHSTKKVALLLRLNHLASKTRRPFYAERNLSKVYVHSERVQFPSKTNVNSMMDFAWMVWDHSYQGEPVIRWL